MVGRDAAPLARVLGPEVSGLYRDLHREHGVGRCAPVATVRPPTGMAGQASRRCAGLRPCFRGGGPFRTRPAEVRETRLVRTRRSKQSRPLCADGRTPREGMARDGHRTVRRASPLRSAPSGRAGARGRIARATVGLIGSSGGFAIRRLQALASRSVSGPPRFDRARMVAMAEAARYSSGDRGLTSPVRAASRRSGSAPLKTASVRPGWTARNAASHPAAVPIPCRHEVARTRAP